MRATRRIGWTARALLPLALLLVGARCYTPDFDNGKLRCGPQGQCPKGYGCASDGTCWKSGAGSSSDGGTDVLDDFVGTWTFLTGTLDANCSDGRTMPSIAGDVFVVTRAGTTLTAGYYCDWFLHVPAGSRTTVIDPAQSCIQDVPDTGTGVTFHYNWSGTEFALTTSNGLSGSISGTVKGPFTATDGSSGTCEGKFTGTLSKS